MPRTNRMRSTVKKKKPAKKPDIGGFAIGLDTREPKSTKKRSTRSRPKGPKSKGGY